LVSFDPGCIEFRPAKGAPSGLDGQLTDFLNAHTAECWIVTVSKEPGQPTMTEKRAHDQADLEAEAGRHPFVKQVLDAFPGAEIKDVGPVETEKD